MPVFIEVLGKDPKAVTAFFRFGPVRVQDPQVKEFVTSVYEQRYQYLVHLLKDIYKDTETIKKHALTLYSLVIGIEFFYRQLTREELELIFSEYLI